MTTFIDAFRQMVLPDLRKACRLQALSVARERCDFTDAYAAVMAQARRRGAAHLPDHALIDLEAWIDTTILKTITDIETRPEAAREIVDEALEGMWATMT
jgi:hypothetical protein